MRYNEVPPSEIRCDNVPRLDLMILCKLTVTIIAKISIGIWEPSFFPAIVDYELKHNKSKVMFSCKFLCCSLFEKK